MQTLTATRGVSRHRTAPLSTPGTANGFPGTDVAALTLVGITYRDLDAPLAAVDDGGRTGEVTVSYGGFALNAGRAAAPLLPEGSVHIVTALPWAEYPAVRRAMPPGAVFDPVLADVDSAARLPDSLELSAGAQDRRSIRKQRHEPHSRLTPSLLPAAALSARVLAAGRLAPDSAREFLRHTQRQGSLFAWCGGAPLPLDVEVQCPVLIVDQDEALELTGREAGPRPLDLALELARRVAVPGAIRVVTGGGSAPTALVWDAGNRWECLEAEPVITAQPRFLKGAGDTFAAHFLAVALAGLEGRERGAVFIKGLQHARFAAAAYVASGTAPATPEVEDAIRARSEYSGVGIHSIRSASVPKPVSQVSLGPVWKDLWRV